MMWNGDFWSNDDDDDDDNDDEEDDDSHNDDNGDNSYKKTITEAKTKTIRVFLAVLKSTHFKRLSGLLYAGLFVDSPF